MDLSFKNPENLTNPTESSPIGPTPPPPPPPPPTPTLEVFKLKRCRQKFSSAQLDLLEGAFTRDQYLKMSVLEELQMKLELSVSQIKVWFRDRRRKYRKSVVQAATTSFQSSRIPIIVASTFNTPNPNPQQAPPPLFPPTARIRPDRSKCTRLAIISLKCSDCGLVVASKAELNAHRLFVHRQLPFPCRAQGCDKEFFHGHQLAAHTQTAHSTSPVKYQCPACDKSFSQNAYLRIHFVRWHEQGTFACTYPGCGYVVHSGLREELKRHTYQDHYEQKWACDEANCEKRFKTKANLKLHQSTHRSKAAALERAKGHGMYERPKESASAPLDLTLGTKEPSAKETSYKEPNHKEPNKNVVLESEIAHKEKEIVDWIKQRAETPSGGGDKELQVAQDSKRTIIYRDPVQGVIAYQQNSLGLTPSAPPTQTQTNRVILYQARAHACMYGSGTDPKVEHNYSVCACVDCRAHLNALPK